MQKMQVVTKAEFARRLGVTRGRVSQYAAMGMPVRLDRRLDLSVALQWVRDNIGPTYRPAGGEDVALTDDGLTRLLDG